MQYVLRMLTCFFSYLQADLGRHVEELVQTLKSVVEEYCRQVLLSHNASAISHAQEVISLWSSLTQHGTSGRSHKSLRLSIT